MGDPITAVQKAVPAVDKREDSFLLEEFKALRNEIDASVQETRFLERSR